MSTVVSIIMSDIIPLRERGTWQGIINIIFAFGSGIGAPLGKFNPRTSDIYLTELQAELLQTPLVGAGLSSASSRFVSLRSF